MKDFTPTNCRYVTDQGVQCQNPPKSRESLCNEHLSPSAMDIAAYNSVTDHFKQDLREFFQRSNFYLIAETALLSVFFTQKKTGNLQ